MSYLRSTKSVLAPLVLAILGLVSSISPATAQLATTYTALQFPGAWATEPSCINASGQIAGYYVDTAFHNFLYDKGVYTTLNTTGYARITGMNDHGQLVGINGGAGFLYDHGVFTTIAMPGGYFSQVLGISNTGRIVGWYSDRDYNDRGFVYDKGVYTTVVGPNAFATYIFGVNSKGQMVGYYIDNDFTFLRGFMCENGVFTDLFVPGSEFLTGQTFPTGINDRGQIAGHYNFQADPNDLNQHGFIYEKGVYTSFDAPGAGPSDYQGTYIYGINARGQLVGAAYNGNDAFPFMLSR